MDAGLTIRRARVVNAGVSRAEVERWLGRVEVESLGLAPDETFYVPRLRMRLAGGGGAPTAFMADHILAALRRLLAAADEGWRTRFAPDRPYRFASRARYHAWLVALWVKDGTAPAREAFRAATGHDTLAAWQRAALLRDGPDLVAAAARLAEIGAAARWIARFEPADLALAMRALDAAFALDLAVPAPVLAAAAIPAAEVERLADVVTALAARGNDWRGLPPAGRTLLLAAATIARAAVRPAGHVSALAPAIAAFAAAAGAAQPQSQPHSALPARAELQSVPPRRPAPIAAPPGRMPAATRAQAPVAPGRPRMTLVELAAAPAPRLEPRMRKRPAAALRPRISSEHPAPAAPETPALLLAPDAVFDTGFGGLLFLVNAFVALGLYPDFTRPRGAQLDPSPLWLADRIGRWRFGARYRRDPLAGWIAAHCAPGRLPDIWRAAPDWLAGFDRRLPLRVTTARRTTFWHRAGFPLEDRPARGRPRPKRRTARAPRPPGRLPAARDDRWATCLALYLDARLRRIAGGGLGLLALPARIAVRDLDLRASFRLDAYPIGLRLAGLDRDPGWQPAEGRALAFGFA
jgi:hypothetical protein